MHKHIVIVGGGPAGYVAALHASSLGARVTLIEAAKIGGTCLNRGCIPTRALIASTSLYDKLKSAARLGIQIGGEVSAPWPSLRLRAERVAHDAVQEVCDLLRQRNVELISGHAWFRDERTVCIDGHGSVQGDFVLICTGSKPARLQMARYDGDVVSSSDDIFEWRSLPSSVSIVGGGAIASEFAFILNVLGVSVTIIGEAGLPSPVLDHEISDMLARTMQQRSIRFLGGVPASKIERLQSGGVKIHRGSADAVMAEKALVCVGRVPNTGGLNLGAAGLTAGIKGEISVDPFMRSCTARIYAAGDVTGRFMQAHTASAQARLAIDHMLGRAPLPLDETLIPAAVLTSPEIAYVGLSEGAARKGGREIRCGKFYAHGSSTAQAINEPSGMTKVVADALTGTVLGVHIMGAHAPDLIQEATAAMRHGACVTDFITATRAHSSLSQSLCEAAEDVFGQSTHGPTKRKQPARRFDFLNV